MNWNRICKIVGRLLVAGVLYSACLEPVQAQNPTCPTRPVGDNTNACASTAFVQSTVSAAAPFYPATGTSAAGIASGHVIPWLDENVQLSGVGVTPIGIVSTNPYIIGAANSTIGSSTVGQTFSVRFTSTGLTGSPITITYTAVGGDTTATIAAALCTAINANTTLNTLTSGSNGTLVQSQFPIFCQSFSGSATFNIQWQASFAPTGATPLTLASVGTGTVNIAATVDNLDYVVAQWGRSATGRTPLANDNLFCHVFTGNSSAGFDTQYGQICVKATAVTSSAQQGLIQFNAASSGVAAQPIFYASKGLVLYDASHAAATSGDIGFGTINVPSTTGTNGYYLGGFQFVNSAGLFAVGNNVFGGTGASSALNLQSTQSGAPAGDFVQITTGGTVRLKVFNSGGVALGGAADPAATGILNVLTGYRIGNAATSGNVLRGNGTNFISATLAAADLSNGVTGSGAVVLAAAPTITGAAKASGTLLVGASSTSITGCSLLVHSGTDQNFCMTGPINLADGVGFLSVNDANNATKSIQFNASQVYYNADVSIGTTTNPSLGGGLLVGQAIKTLSTTASSSPTTGSGIFGGGIGVSGDVWASGNHSVSVAAKTLVLKQGANGAVGTFVCTGGGTITISNTNFATTDAVIFGMNTAGGTITTPPAMKTVTGGTGFTVLCGATDTSTYNYALIKNAA